MRNSSYSTIVFDFDGTIADSFWVLFDIFDEKREEFSIRVIDKDEVETFKNLSTMEVLKELDISILKLPFFIKTFRDEMNERIKGVTAFDGMEALLRHLKELNFTLGVLTSNSIKNVEEFMDNNSLTNVIDFIYEDDSIFWKNKTMEKIMSNYNLKPEEILYVGDQVRDVTAAQKESIPVAAVTWGYNSKELLTKSKPTYVVDTPQQLQDIICG